MTLTVAVFCLAAFALTGQGRMGWVHLSSAHGDLPVPGASQEQTASLILDVDRDGLNDFVIGARQKGPSVVWFRRTAQGWTRYVVDPDFLPIEAGGAVHDIDGDGDLDIVLGEDASGRHLYWWENPYPRYHPEISWVRRAIKDSGANKHHDQVFGDFDGDGRAELVFWNQRGRSLYLAEIPSHLRTTSPWPLISIFGWDAQGEFEGLAGADIGGSRGARSWRFFRQP